MNSCTTTIDLLRHGEPEGGRRFRGSTDDPLSDLGWQQMKERIAPHSGWHRIVTSPLIRCQDFSTFVSKKMEIPIRIEKGLQEIHFGDWEGKTSDEIEAIDSHSIKRFWENPVVNTPKRGERIVDFSNRVLNTWHTLIEEYKGQHLLLVGHGGSHRIILTDILNLPLESMFRIEMPFACLTRVVIYHEDFIQYPTLCFHNP